MDMETKRDMESMAEWAATQDAWDRLQARRRRPWHRALRFWLSPWQVADGPVAAVSASGDPRAPLLPSGAGTGAAGPQTTATPANGSPHRLVSGTRLPGGPHH